MENNTFLLRIKNEGRSFFEAVGKANEFFYLVLITTYVGLFFFLKIQWTEEMKPFCDVFRLASLAVIMWGTTLYLLFVIAEWRNLWKNVIPLIILAVIFLGGTYYFSKRMSTNLFSVVMDIVLCILAYKKNFKKILKCLLSMSVVMLVMAGIGMAIGVAIDCGKPETDTPGHSLGINYPNTWGYLVFFALIILWYLYLRFKPVITFAIFWAVSVFMYSYITCRTIAGMTLLFPLAALFTDVLEKRMDRKSREGTLKKHKPIEWIVTIIPFLAWAFMMANSYAVDWWYQFYHGPLRNLAWRFLMGGLYFKKYGLPLVGNPYRANDYTYINVQGEFIQVGILDSSFAAYMIMRGLIWLIYTLLWLCLAYRKALKKRDYAIILIETFFLGFAMIERPGLELWYNFVLLYPLAKVFNKPRTEKFLEFDEEEVPDKGTQFTEFEKEYKTFMQIKTIPSYRVEEAEVTSIGFDAEKGVYILNLPTDIEKQEMYDVFTSMLYTERFIKGDDEKKPLSAGFIRYGAAQAQLAYQMGFKNISNSETVSMKELTKAGVSLEEYVQRKYDTAKEAFSGLTLNEEAIEIFYDFLGVRSFCELYTTDFDRSAYDYSGFEEKVGSDLFNRIDNHMHGRIEEFLYNLAIKDYEEVQRLLNEH